MKPIYSFISYRRYLAEFYQFKKRTEQGFSYRQFSAAVGVKMPNFLPWLIDGTRNLGETTMPMVVSALGLSQEEGEYFALLVKFDQSKIQSERETLFGRITSIRTEKSVELIEEKRHLYFSDWSVVAIRELLNIVRINPKVDDGYYRLGSMLRPRISRTEAHRAVKILADLGLVEAEPDGTLYPTKSQLTTGDEVPGFFSRQFHKQMLERADESMDIFPSDQRDVSSVTMSVSVECQMMVKDAIQRFRGEIEALVRADLNEPNRVIQLNMQMFPLAETHK